MLGATSTSSRQLKGVSLSVGDVGGADVDVLARDITTSRAIRFGSFGTTPSGLDDTTNPVLHVAGSAVVAQVLRVNHVIANIVTQTSDARKKHNIRDLSALPSQEQERIHNEAQTQVQDAAQQADDNNKQDRASSIHAHKHSNINSTTFSMCSIC